MTRPIYEPSLQRTDARLGYGQNQLFRRPAPTPAAAGTPIEWIALTSSTNWGASLTTMNFTLLSGSYDTVTPTFDINASDNLEINKAGDYTMDWSYSPSGTDGSGTTWTHIRAEIARLSGPTPAGLRSWTAGVFQGPIKLAYVPGSPLNGDEGAFSWFHQYLHWDDGDFSGTPTEFEMQGVRYIDGVETIWNEVVFVMLVVRLGDPYPVP